MESTTISGLTEGTTMADTDNMVFGGTDAKKITWANVLSLIKSKLNIGSTSLSGIGDGTITGAVKQINTDVTDLKDDSATELFSLTASANTTSLTGKGYYNKATGEVDILFFASGTYASTTSVIASIPSGYRPSAATNCQVVVFNSSDVCSPYIGSISTAGNITQGFGSNITRVLVIAKYII